MSQSLRILHILRAPVGGLFRHVRDLAKEQSARGHQVGILADAATENALTNKQLFDLKPSLSLGLHQIPMSRNPGFADLTVVRHANKLIDRLNVDVLHGHGAKGGLYARICGHDKKGKGQAGACTRFYTPHGGSLHYRNSPVKGAVFIGAEKALRQRTDGFIFESQFARNAYEASVGTPKKPMRVIANGLQTSDFERIEPDQNAADFLFVGELRMLKGVDILLKALAQLPDHSTLVIVGDGPDGAEFRALTASLDLNDRVTFTGAMPIKQAFGRGKTLIVPSRAESLPYVVLEAAAAGVPLIASNVGGIPEIVNGTDTQLVPAADEHALAKAMKAALIAPERARNVAEILRTTVGQRFTVQNMTTAVLDFYADRIAA